MEKERADETKPPITQGTALRLTLLGKVAANFNGRELVLANRKCWALLGYLALSDGMQETRERLIGTLWSETAEDRARASLRQALYELRSALESVGLQAVTTSKVSIALDRGRVSADIWEVVDSAKAGRAHPLLLNTERLTDTLLTEFETIDPAFRTWLITRRQALHDQLVRHLAPALRGDAAPAQADIARALMNLDPTDEAAARTLMRLRMQAGDVGGALATYKRLWDLLAEEFDVEPSKETQELVAAIKLGQPDSSQASTPAAASSSRLGAAEIEGPATLTIFARGVSDEHARALEQVMSARADAAWQPISEETQKAWLVETPSASEAAKLAFQLQSACRAMPNAPRLLMGAHASSLQVSAAGGLDRALAAMAQPGQIMTSQEFRDRLTDGLDATVHDLGFVQPPRMDESLRAFTVTPPEEPSGLYLPEGTRLRPAIAVLPFELRAANDDSATLGDLLADEIITVLSGAKDLDVISRLSTRFMNRQGFGLSEIWSHLQSDYVLAGKPRTGGSAAELVIELTDARSNVARWSQTRDLGVLDSAGVHELAVAIASEVMSAILVTESERATTSPLASLHSYTLLFAAITLMDRWTRTSFDRSHELLAALHERAPTHPLPNAWLAAWHIRSISQGWTNDAAADGRAAIEYAQRSLDADPHCSLALAMDGWANVYAYKRLDVAADRLSLAVESNPSDSLAWLLKGVTHAFNDEGSTAAQSATRALRLSPLDPRRSYYDSLIATTALAAGNYDQGIELAKRSLRANRLHASTLRTLAACQWWSGRHDEARQTVAQLLALDPTMTVSRYLRAHPAGETKFGRLAADPLRLAGVPA
jgi:DNA-binding SARP family transcriptional activator/TolB-like protein